MDGDDAGRDDGHGDKYGAAAANFLFGNIDERGRLEEADYLDSEAKEHLSNVVSTLAATEELDTVARTFVAGKGAVPEEEEDYDREDDGEVPHAPDAIDYADEDEEPDDEFDESDQQRLATVALQKVKVGITKPSAGDDDENYDEDDEGADAADTRAAPRAGDKPAEPPAATGQKGDEEDDDMPEIVIDPNATLHFTRIFVLPPQKVPKAPKRKHLGLDASKLRGDQQQQETQEISDDDVDMLNATPESVEIDPVDAFLRQDEESESEREEEAAPEPEEAPVNPDVARPLRSVPVKLNGTLDTSSISAESMLVQTTWEEKIQWESDDDSEELQFEDATAEPTKPAAAADNDDDADAWEDVTWVDTEDAEDEADQKDDKASQSARGDASAADPMDTTDDPSDAKTPAKADEDGGPDAKADDAAPQGAEKDGETGADGEGEKAAAAEEPKDGQAPTGASAGAGADSLEEPQVEGIVTKLLKVNEQLEADMWTEAIQWDSASDDERAHKDTLRRLTRLWLDMNDPGLSLEPLVVDAEGGSDTEARPADAAKESAEQAAAGQNANADPFNVSNDKFYLYGGSVRGRRVDRQSVLRGLHHAPPCVKARTSDCVPDDEYLINFHRPKLSPPRLNYAEKLNPMRRKRPKAGTSQSTAQVPKKRSDLSAAAKDAFRVYLFEYALERLPVVLPIMGMASRLITYARRRPRPAGEPGSMMGGAAAPAGPPPSEVVQLARDEPPPLYAGDLPPDGTPVSVLESTLFAAPCKAYGAPTTDFLVIQKDNQYYVREIDEVVSLGVTEPRMEVMAPNTDRFKRYAHDRVLLWILREFERKKRKGIEPVGLKRTDLANAFTRRRTYPQTSLPKILKEVSIFEGGTYIMSEPAKGFPALEAEKLRTINPEETCAFEAMEAGWEALIRMGIRIFTHPTSQGNILAVAEKTGMSMGRRVAELIRQQLLQTPWYRSSQMLDAQKSFRTQLNSALTRARAAQDLADGGSTAESRLAQMSSDDCLNLLTSFYRVSQKKIPSDLEGRRDLLRQQPFQKAKGKAPEKVDFPQIVQEVITKHRALYSKAGSAANAAGGEKGSGGSGGQGPESTGLRVIPLEAQLKAFKGNHEDIPAEDAKVASAYYETTLLKLEKYRAESEEKPKPVSDTVRPAAPMAAKPEPEKKHVAPVVKKIVPPAMNGGETKDGGEAGKDPHHRGPTKKIKKLKVTRKVRNAQGEEIKEVRIVTEPAEIERLKGQQAARAKKLKAQKEGSTATEKGDDQGKDEGGGAKSENPLKISIGLDKISKATKAGKSVLKGTEGSETTAAKRLTAEGHSKIGKIKIDRRIIEEAKQKRKRLQYGDDADYTPRKQARKRAEKSTSRRARNGMVVLNEILAKVERSVRNAVGYIAETEPELIIRRVKPGEPTPESAKNLAKPRDTGLDFTVPVKNVPAYGQVVKEQMYLNLIRIRCTQAPYHYRSGEMFLSDMRLLAENARRFNTTSETQWVVQHAELLLEAAEEKVGEVAEEIKEAEEAIQTEEKNARENGPALAEGSPLGEGEPMVLE